ncbi:MAG: hypothetical protein ACK5JR_03025 [Tropicimonas sp.]|uniref:hypothetical protein n=1 Tax=Tropicimonas sp. TaxID=2067044 RepID=UPI003A8A867F
MRLVLPIALSCLSLAMTGCNRPPELEAAITEEARAAPAPKLTDIRMALAPAETIRLDEAEQARMAARGAALQDRAKAATGPVISAAEAQDAQERAARLRQARAAQVAEGH